MDRLVDPVLGDVELERREALAAERVWLARWIVISGYVGLVRALALHGVRSAAALRLSSDAARTAAFSAFAFLVLTYAFVVRPWMRLPRVTWYTQWAAFGVDLIPQSLPLTVPLALSFGIVCGWSWTISMRAAMRRAIILGVGGILIALSTMEWMIPAANQRFRNAVASQLAEAGRVPRPIGLGGISERSLSELASLRRNDAMAVVAMGELMTMEVPYTVQRLDEIFHRRVALAFAAGPFCLAAAAIALVFRRRTYAVVVFCAVLLLYIAALLGVQGMSARMPSIAWAWLPNAALTAFAIALLRRVPRRPDEGQILN